jgi:hypothetical protein
MQFLKSFTEIQTLQNAIHELEGPSLHKLHSPKQLTCKQLTDDGNQQHSSFLPSLHHPDTLVCWSTEASLGHWRRGT